MTPSRSCSYFIRDTNLQRTCFHLLREITSLVLWERCTCFVFMPTGMLIFLLFLINRDDLQFTLQRVPLENCLRQRYWLFELFKLTDSRPLISRVNILKISGPAQHNSLHSFCKGRGVQCYILQFTKLVKTGNTLITNDFLWKQRSFKFSISLVYLQNSIERN